MTDKTNLEVISLPKYRVENFGKIPAIGFSSEDKNIIEEVRGPLNELLENLQIEEQETPLVEDSELPDALIFAMKETTGRRCMKAAEDELVVNNFLCENYFRKFEIRIPYPLLCDEIFVKKLDEMGEEMQFTFYIPGEDPPDKCSEKKGKSIDYNQNVQIQFFCLKSEGFTKVGDIKKELQKEKGNVGKMKRGIGALKKTPISTTQGLFSPPKKLERQKRDPSFVEIWVNKNDQTVNEFLRNIKNGADPYNYGFEENPTLKKVENENLLSDVSAKFRRINDVLKKYHLNSIRRSGPVGDLEVRAHLSSQEMMVNAGSLMLFNFKNLKSIALQTLSVICLDALNSLDSKKKALLEDYFGYWGNLAADLGIFLLGGTYDKIAIKMAKNYLASLLSEVLSNRYRLGMEEYISSGISLTLGESADKFLEKNGASLSEKSGISATFDPETLIQSCKDYPTVAFVRGTAEPTKDIGVLREWGSNATVASGGDKTFYLLQVLSIFKWLQTVGTKITDIVGHSRGAGLAYNAAMLFNYLSGKDGRKISFCGLDGAITLPVALSIRLEVIKPNSLFSRNINMASILDGALLDPNGYQERVIPNCTESDSTTKNIMKKINFSGTYEPLTAVFLAVAQQTVQGIGHDAGTAGTGYRKKLEEKIKEAGIPWIDVATGFKKEGEEVRKVTWPVVSEYGKKIKHNDSTRYTDLYWFWLENKKEWHFRKIMRESQPTKTFYRT